MPNRRQFLELGLAASIWPGLVTAAARPMPWTPAEAFPPSRLHKAIFDKSYAPARDFAARMASRGIAVHAIDGDITGVWFNDLALRWRESPAAIAGLTEPEALFCLEQLAWDHRMRVVLRTAHAHRPLLAWVIAPVVRT